MGYFVQGGVNLDGPAYDWWYGCSPTSAGMMMGYYDIHGYGGKSYANLVPGGTAESNTFGTLSWSYQVNNIIASRGYVGDYYRNSSGIADYANGGNDSGYLNNSKDDAPGAKAYNCLAYFMGTSQDAAIDRLSPTGNPNGSTRFYYDPNGGRLYARDVFDLRDGMLGMDQYFRSRGYGTGTPLADDRNFFTQLISTSPTSPGFSFADYKNEIDNGRVMMIQIANEAKHTGHSMFGYGYTDAGQIIFRDTWNRDEHVMAWGGSYSGMAQWGVTGFDPTGGSPVPLPGAVWLQGSGLVGLWGTRRRWGSS